MKNSRREGIPYRTVTAKRRAAGKLASKKEIKAQNEFYQDIFSDNYDDAEIVRVNREIVKRKFFHSTGHCKAHNNLDCIYCRDMLRG